MSNVFHNHQWVEVERFSTRPVGSFRGGEGRPTEDFERLLLGVTTILYRCECGEIKTVEVLGGNT